MEERVNDSLSFSYFCGMPIEQAAPDHSTISRFRTQMTKSKAYDALLQGINAQLESHAILVKTGAIVDASVVDTPLKPKGKAIYQVVEQDSAQTQDQDNASKPRRIVEKHEHKAVDNQGAWVKKGGKLRYGYKKHYVTNQEGLVLGVLTTPANVQEISKLEAVLEMTRLPPGIGLQADKGYQSEKNRILLRERGLKDRILKKASKHKGLSQWESRFNRHIGRTRYKIARTFGSIKRWFKSQGARYRGPGILGSMG